MHNETREDSFEGLIVVSHDLRKGAEDCAAANQRRSDAWFSESIACNYDSGAGAADFGKVARDSHSDVETGMLAANDRAIDIWLVQRALQSTASCTSTVASLTKLARLTSWWQHPRSDKRRSVDDFFTVVQQL